MHSAFHIALLLLWGLAFLSCSTERQEKMEAEILSIHDEVMPQLPLLKKYQRQLKVMKDEQPMDSMRCQAIIDSLVKADELMWNWMEQYISLDQVRDSLSGEEVDRYLVSQRQKIEEVEQMTIGAMDAAEREIEKERE